MRRRLRLAVIAAADAAAKFALEKKGQKVLNVKLYETGYDNSNEKQVGTQFVLLRLPLKGTEKAPKPAPKAFPDTSAPTPPEPS